MKLQPGAERLLIRWGRGLRVLAAAWFLLLLYAWLRSNAESADVLLLGALPAACYWTAGHLLVKWARRR